MTLAAGGSEFEVLVHEKFRRCVGFLCADLPNPGTGVAERRPVGTAMFFGYPTTDGRARIPYIVTTAHTVYGARARNLSLHLVIPCEAGPGVPLEFPTGAATGSWQFHPKSDVAVHRIQIPERHDIKWLQPEAMITRADVERLSVGLGDELFFVTLFEQLPGRSRDLPILRFGNVARMPEELVAIELADGWSVDVEAFLVEARSWGGESGAPTFLYFPMDRQAEGLGVGSILISTTEEPSSIANVKGLLGMVHGHYDIARSVKRGGLVADHVDPASQWSGTVAVNAGVAIIIPAWTIMETLDQEELMADRKKVEDEIAKTEPRPTADSAFPDDPTVTRDGFMKDLEQVSQPLDTQE